MGTSLSKERIAARYSYYLCGRCNTQIEYLPNERKESAIPCDDCGYTHGERPYMLLPPEIKIDLTQY